MSWTTRTNAPARLLLLAAPLALLLSAAQPAEATDAPVVAVLYFDNNTGDAGLDVLQKGFADMLITDMSSVPDITVVERDKLQKLLDELALQKTSYFDKKTAVKLGQGLGAKYAVSGSFAASSPKLRIDVRMIEIATGKVVVASKVTGPGDDIFALEQQLVDKFAAAIKKEFAPAARPLTRVSKLDTVIDFSKAIDLADHGKLEQAELALGKVVKAAPTFALARTRHAQIQEQLRLARERRETTIADSGAELAKRARDHLKGKDLSKLNLEDSKLYLTYRIVHGSFLLRQLGEEVTGRGRTKIARRGHEAAVRKLVDAYYANTTKLIAELGIYAQRHTQTFPNGATYLDSSLKLPPDDVRRASLAGFSPRLSVDPIEWQLRLSQFLLLGEADAGSDAATSRFTLVPTPAELKPAYLRLGYDGLERSLKIAQAKVAATPGAHPSQPIQILELHSEALLLRGELDAGVAKLQKILDDYPSVSSYDRFERQIKQQIGLAHNADVKSRDRYVQGLQSCKDMDLRVGLSPTLHRRVRTMGLAAIEHLEKEVLGACSSNPKLTHFWEYLYSHLATEAAQYDDCARFDAYMIKYLAAGGAKSSEAGYRRNYSSCP